MEPKLTFRPENFLAQKVSVGRWSVQYRGNVRKPFCTILVTFGAVSSRK